LPSTVNGKGITECSDFFLDKPYLCSTLMPVSLVSAALLRFFTFADNEAAAQKDTKSIFDEAPLAVA
jgi:hypothetical protein